MDLQLTDRVFLVTGAARGLGRATADVLVAEGARVVHLRPRPGLARRCRRRARRPGRGRGRRQRRPGPGRPDGGRGVRHLGPARRRPGLGRRTAGRAASWTPPTRSGPPRSSRSSSAPSGSRARWRERLDGGRLDRLRAVQLGAGADRRAGHLQRPAPRPRDGGQDPGRRARPARDPGQRADARPDRDRTAPRARRPWRRPGGVAGEVARRHPAAHGTDGPRSSAGRRRSCSARRRHSCRA